MTQKILLLKRFSGVITDRCGTVELFFNNPGYTPYRLPVPDLVQLWQVRGFLSTSIPPRPDWQGNAMERLQEVIALMGQARQLGCVRPAKPLSLASCPIFAFAYLPPWPGT